MSLRKEQIVLTALRMLDRDGLEGMTLRRLTGELDKPRATHDCLAKTLTSLSQPRPPAIPPSEHPFACWLAFR